MLGGVRSDATSIMLVAGQWTGLLAIKLATINNILATVGILMAIGASFMAIVDHGMKIHGKITESKKRRHERKQTNTHTDAGKEQ